MNILKTGSCKVFCCVSDCKSKGTRDRNLSFHLFPKPNVRKVPLQNKDGITEMVDIRTAWILLLNIGKRVSKWMKVCSLYFKQEDFSHFDLDRTRRVLKKEAIPSCKLPKIPSNRNPKQNKNRVTGSWRQRVSEVQKKDAEMLEVENSRDAPDDVLPPVEQQEENSNEMEKREIAEILCSLGMEMNHRTCDATVQVNSGDTQQNFVDSIDSDKKLSSITGLSSLTLLDTLAELITGELASKKILRLKMNVKSRIVLTFMKLKTNITYTLLSIIFNSVVSSTMCKNIFCECIQILAFVLKPAVPFQSLDEIALNRPLCFADFPNVRVVLDCTEVKVEKPKCLCCQLKLYSSYKQTTTIKFMVGVAPSGLITI